MLDDFINEQNITYKTMINSVKNNKQSHAYLIEANGYPKSLDFAKAFAKALLCPKSYSNNKNCNKCNQCINIDRNEFVEFKLIEPDGQWIKKSQLEELQELFSKKAVIGSKKIYIINKADRLNISSSNSLLKFLEEPENGIIAILVADNKNQLLPTVVSRCQILSLKNKRTLNELSTIEKVGHYLKDSSAEIVEYTNNEDSIIKLGKVVDFIKYYEKNGVSTLIYTNKLWNEYIKEKNEIFDAFTIMLLVYKDILNFKINKNLEVFNEYVNDIKELSEKNNLDTITSKINVIINLREKIKFNINSNILMDKLIIELEGCE